MGVAVWALITYIAVIVVWNAVLKRNIGEAMVLGFVVVSLFGGSDTLAGRGRHRRSRRRRSRVRRTRVRLHGIPAHRTGPDRSPSHPAQRRFRADARRLGYVSTAAAALIGWPAGSGSGIAASVGSVTIPWMIRSKWRPDLAASLVAGNAGLGISIPPSSSDVPAARLGRRGAGADRGPDAGGRVRRWFVDGSLPLPRGVHLGPPAQDRARRGRRHPAFPAGVEAGLDLSARLPGYRRSRLPHRERRRGIRRLLSRRRGRGHQHRGLDPRADHHRHPASSPGAGCRAAAVAGTDFSRNWPPSTPSSAPPSSSRSPLPRLSANSAWYTS